MNRKLTVLALVCFMSLGAIARAQCDISGDITASANTDPAGPAWVYTLTIHWDTDEKYALSHMDLLIDAAGGSCSLQDIAQYLSWGDPIGTSDGEGGCTVSYMGELSDNGDPSIPGVTGLLLKFEPYDGCEPGNVGTGVFVFYSDLGPVPVDEDMLSLVDKYAQMYCFGHLTGMFPGLACDPVAEELTSFGSLKGMYR